MNALWRALPAYMRVSLSVMFQYRGEIVLWAVWGVIYPTVAIAMWTSAVAGSPDQTQIRGYDARDFTAYFLMTMIVGHVTTAWDVYEMGWLVRGGNMSPKLLRPLLPIWESMTGNVAYKTLTLALLVPIWLIVGWFTEPRFGASVGQLLLGCLASLLASAISFLWGYVVATAAFWVTRMDSVSEMWFAMSLFLGGRIAPLDVLPTPLQWIAAFLPFKWMIGFPAEALIGRLTVGQLAAGLFWQAAWLIGGVIVFRFTWRAAVKQYSAVGA